MSGITTFTDSYVMTPKGAVLVPELNPKETLILNNKFEWVKPRLIYLKKSRSNLVKSWNILSFPFTENTLVDTKQSKKLKPIIVSPTVVDVNNNYSEVEVLALSIMYSNKLTLNKDNTSTLYLSKFQEKDLEVVMNYLSDKCIAFTTNSNPFNTTVTFNSNSINKFTYKDIFSLNKDNLSIYLNLVFVYLEQGYLSLNPPLILELKLLVDKLDDVLITNTFNNFVKETPFNTSTTENKTAHLSEDVVQVTINTTNSYPYVNGLTVNNTKPK